MEQILPDRYEVLMALDETMERMGQRMRQILAQKGETLAQLRSRLEQHAVGRRIALQRQAVGELQARLEAQMARIVAQKAEVLAPVAAQLQMAERHLLQRKSQQLESLAAQLLSLDPKNRLQPGFVQLVKDDKPTTLEHLASGDRVRLEDGRRVAEATIETIRPVS